MLAMLAAPAGSGSWRHSSFTDNLDHLDTLDHLKRINDKSHLDTGDGQDLTPTVQTHIVVSYQVYRILGARSHCPAALFVEERKTGQDMRG